jgi:hypothetical protein
MEPYIELRIARLEKSLLITARLDLAPAVGPVIEFDYECRPEEIEATINGIKLVEAAFPEREVL